MLNEQEMLLNEILRRIAESLDISPTDYERAVQSYGAVGNWLERGFEDEAYPGSLSKPEIYPQGSIRIGTVVKPLRDSEDASYDVDIICELQYFNIESSSNNAEVIKQMVGKRLKSHVTYCDKLDDEGKRCWTLEYAKDNGIGFHIDVLPCVPDPIKGAEITKTNQSNSDTQNEFTKTTIALTDKEDGRSPPYKWRSSNPHGYAKWFQEQNTTFAQFATHQKQEIFANTRNQTNRLPLYENVQAVPDQLVRTPLQRAIQILKRHRDIRFSNQRQGDFIGNPKFKPVSIIITTLAARLYEDEGDVLSALINIVTKLSYHSALVENRYAQLDESVAQRELIRRKSDGTWEIQNPVNPSENFSDRWHEDNHARAKAFFVWMASVKSDIQDAVKEYKSHELKKLLGDRFGERSLNEAWTGYEKDHNNQSKDLIIGASRALARFDVPHRQPPIWPVLKSYSVNISARIKINGSWVDFNSDCNPLPKHCDLLFLARTDVPKPFNVYWQVVNTGREAEIVAQLRGEIFASKTAGVGGLTQKEATRYKGMHWIECFIVKNGKCVARSDEFVVNIM